jgi:hypothetical protein
MLMLVQTTSLHNGPKLMLNNLKLLKLQQTMVIKLKNLFKQSLSQVSDMTHKQYLIKSYIIKLYRHLIKKLQWKLIFLMNNLN